MMTRIGRRPSLPSDYSATQRPDGASLRGVAALAAAALALLLCAAGWAQSATPPFPLDNFTASASEPSIAVAPNGRVGCAWVSRDAGEWRLIFRERIAPDVWSEPTIFGPGPGSQPGAPYLLYDAYSNPRLIWRDGPTGQRAIQYAFRHSGVWVRFGPLSSGSVYEFAEPAAAFDPAGRLHVVWPEGDGSFQQIAAATLDATGGMKTETLTQGRSDRLNLYPTVISGPRAAVLWYAEQFSQGRAEFVVEARFYDAAQGRWEAHPPPQDLSLLPTNRLPYLFGAGDDMLCAVWYDTEDGLERIFFGLGGELARGAGILADDNEAGPNVQPFGALTPDGVPVVAWRGLLPGGPAIFIRKHGPEIWLPPVTLSLPEPPAPARPRLAADDRTAYVVWISEAMDGGTGNLYFSTAQWDDE